MSSLNPFRKKDENLDHAIAEAYEDLKNRDYDTPEAKRIVARITELNALKPKGLSADTLAVVLGNLGLAAIYIGFEKSHVISTKFPNFLVKTTK